MGPIELSRLLDLDQLTDATLKAILESYENCEVEAVHMGEILGREGRGENDNFNSTMYQFEVKYTCAGAEKELHIIVKSPPENPVAACGSKLGKPFARESMWYSVMQQELAKVLPDIKSILPRCLHAAANFQGQAGGFCQAQCPWFCWCPCQSKERAVILLENLSRRDPPCFLIKKREVPELKYILLAMRSLAKFHGAWLLYRHRLKLGEIDSPPFTYQELTALVKSNLPTSFIKPMVGESLKLVEALLKNAGDTRSETWLRLYRSKKSIARVSALIPGSVSESSSAIITVGHGDFWSNNMMFVNGDDGEPSKAIIIDFQMMGLMHPTCDIIYLLYVNTDRGFRDQHLSAILSAYYAELKPCLEQCGIDYNLDTLHQEYQQNKDYGLLTAAQTMPNVLNPVELRFSGIMAIQNYNRQRRECLLNTTTDEHPMYATIRSRLMEMGQELAEDNFLGLLETKNIS